MPRKEKSRGIVDDDDVFDTASNAMVRKQVVDHLPRVLNAGVDFGDDEGKARAATAPRRCCLRDPTARRRRR